MKVIDCFMFYNEIDVLKIRLHELYNVVDCIILVEATTTHTGKPKPLYYLENKNSFEKYNDKIIHIVTNFEENYSFGEHIKTNTVDWYRENYQRECIQNGLNQLNLLDDDIIIVTDIDEIPNKKIIQNIKECQFKIENNIIKNISMNLYYYNIELTTHRIWLHAKMFNYFTYKNNKLLTSIRLGSGNGKYETIENGGWHLTYFGDENFIKNKVESFAESTEYTTEGKDINYLRDCISQSILHFNKEVLIHIPLGMNNNVPSFFKEL